MSSNSPASGEHFNIRWKNYTSVLHSVFRNLLEEERLVDVTLGCEGGFVKCHRFILTACSSYFDNLLHELQTEHHVVIFMKDLKLWELKALIHFMYNGEVSVKQKQLDPLMRAAESLHIRGLSAEGGKDKRYEDEEEDDDEEVGVEEMSDPLQIPSTKQKQGVKRSSINPSGGPPKFLKLEKFGTAGSRAAAPRKNTLLQKIQNAFRENGPALGHLYPKIESEDVHDEEGENSKDNELSESNLNKKEEEGAQYDDEAGTSAPTVKTSLKVITRRLRQPVSDDHWNEQAQSPPKIISKNPSVLNTSTQGNPVRKSFDSNHPKISEPAMTDIPITDANDRAIRLQKATNLAIGGVTVRQAAAHFGIPRTTLCAYMKRQGLAGKRVMAANAVANAGANSNVNSISDQLQIVEVQEALPFAFLGLSDIIESYKEEPNGADS